MNKSYTYLGCLLLGMLLTACVTERGSNLPEGDIVGLWVLEKAYKEGKESALLEGVMFHFDESGKVRTNFNARMEEDTMPYEWKDDGNLLLKSKPNEISARASGDPDGHLILEVKMMDMPFRLVMKRAETESDGMEPDSVGH